MTQKHTTKKEIKQQLRGYKVSIRSHKLIQNAVKVYITDVATGSMVYGDFNVYAADFRAKHAGAIEYADSLSGYYLDTGEKII